MTRPLCFIAMPFGRKEAGGRSVEFDAVWKDLIAPAIEAADMQPLRADEEQSGGIIHKPMFERLILCEFAVADRFLEWTKTFERFVNSADELVVLEVDSLEANARHPVRCMPSAVLH